MARRKRRPDVIPGMDMGEFLGSIHRQDYNQAFVMMGYGDLFGLNGRMLHFHTERLRGQEAVDVVSLVPEYNEYDGVETGRAVAHLLSTGRASSIEFGREYSPVLYVFYDAEHEEYVMDKLSELSPDELDVKVPGYMIRAWWD